MQVFSITNQNWTNEIFRRKHEQNPKNAQTKIGRPALLPTIVV